MITGVTAVSLLIQDPPPVYKFLKMYMFRFELAAGWEPWWRS